MCACVKEKIMDISMISESTDNADCIADSRIAVDSRIECKDGCLHFPDAESCLNTIQLLASASDSERKEFESSFNFQSMRSWVDLLKDDLEQCTTQSEYDDVWEYCKEYLYKEGDVVLPKITAVGYMSIANLDGVFYIGGIKHTVTPESVVIEDTESSTRSADLKSIEYNVPFTVPTDTRTTEMVRCTDNRYETSKYKIFSRTNLIRYTTAEKIKDKTIYKMTFAIQVHTFGHKKKAIIGWNDYKDRYYIEEFHFDVIIGNYQGTFREYCDHFSHSEYCRDLYYTQPWDESGGFFAFDTPDIPMPQGVFRCIVHRCRSRSLGNCGVLTDKSPCRPAPILPLKPCIE